MINKILQQLGRSTPNIVYVSDMETYNLDFLNESGKRLLNIPNDEYLEQKKCYEIIHGLSVPCEQCSKQSLELDEVNRYTVENKLVQKHFLHHEKCINIDKKRRLVILSDITDVIAERSTKESLLSCIETLYSDKNPEESITNLLHILATSYNASHAYIFTLTQCNTYFNCTHQWCSDDALPFTKNSYTIPFAALGKLVEALETKGVIRLNSCDIKYFNKLICDRLKELKINLMVMAPLYDKHGEFLGLVGINNPGKADDDVGLISSVCKFVADFLEKTALIESLNVLSYSDALTNLKNRHSYSLTLAEFEESPPSTLGVIYFDVNGLKEINDKHGHAKGDEVLISLGNVLKDIFAEDAFRIAGDEFVVLKANIAEHDFDILVQQLRDKLENVEGLSVSFGHIWNDNFLDIAKQIESADSLMYTEKLVYYQNSQEHLKYRTTLLNSLVADIQAGRFAVFLQPQFTLSTSELCGAEALLRKVNSSKNIDSPAYFVPLYEKLEIVHLLDLYVFETICQVLKDWRTACYDELSVSVNISRVTLKQPNIADKFITICEKYKIAPDKILIEITETMQAPSSEFFSDVLRDIASKGFLLSLDDFGSGYSSLLTLAESEFSEIKIDQEFIKNLTKSKRALSLVKYTINMCNELDIFDTVAEGIETQEVCDMLKGIQCTKGQGYLFDKALPIDVFSQKYIFPRDW